MTKTKILKITSFLATLSLLAAACGPAKPAAFTNEEVLVLTASTLGAMDAGDYEAFTNGFSSEMISTFSEDKFTELRDLLQATSGNFISTGELTLTNKQGFAIYRILCTYELEDVVVTIVFKVDGTQVEGLFFDSPNLRTTSE
jgi:hypothetical protein